MTAAGPVLEDRYFSRMARSAGDKVSRILPWVAPGVVVDVGAGGGELSSAIAETTGSRVLVIDKAEDALRRLRARAGVETLQRTVGAGRAPFTAEPADTVVFCSVLHEVFSYAEHPWDAHGNAIAAAAASLRPGGRLLIRDGVMPDDPVGAAMFRAPDDGFVRDYLERTPHAELRELRRDSEGWWAGTRHAVAEALLTLTWGRGSLERESQERYQLATLAGYASLVERHGFTLIMNEAWTQAGYLDALSSYVIRTESAGGVRMPWFPQTNAFWVFERDAPSTSR